MTMNQLSSQEREATPKGLWIQIPEVRAVGPGKGYLGVGEAKQLGGKRRRKGQNVGCHSTSSDEG